MTFKGFNASALARLGFNADARGTQESASPTPALAEGGA